MNTRLIICASVGALSMSACARTQAKLDPAPGATVVASGPGKGAEATVAGVRVVARAGAWEWEPRDLASQATAIFIELENNAQSPLLVRYNRIALNDEAGHKFNAMPPYDVDGSVTERFTVTNPYYGFSRFAVAPYLRRWYPRFSPYDGSFAYDASYYSPYITRYARVQLPTADMVQRALPEGVLSEQGRVSGFVYFEALDRDAGTLTLTVDLVNARTNAVLATARIPFLAH